MTRRLISSITLLIFFLLFACSKESVDNSPTLSLLSLTVNGITISDNSVGVPTDGILEFTFSRTIDPNLFESNISILETGQSIEINKVISYTNSNSKVQISLNLEPSRTYTIRLEKSPLGINGEQLLSSIDLSFMTADSVEDGITPCFNLVDCKQTIEFMGSMGLGKLDIYSNYPLIPENIILEQIDQAVIVVHGSGFNANDYYRYINNTINELSLSKTTLIIAPQFNNDSAIGNDFFYWSGFNYRDGDESSNDNKLSSFAALDQIISFTGDKNIYPNLDKIVITGQSSGGRYLHLYTGANDAEKQYPTTTFDYIVSESQYFYYPDGRRIDENNSSLYVPEECADYDSWPFGFKDAPPYLNNISIEEFNNRFVNRDITYLLGGGNEVDGSLNTNNCAASLLGSNRYKRGENIYKYMDIVYPDIHKHKKVIVPNITHNGSAIYQSTEFGDLLLSILE